MTAALYINGQWQQGHGPRLSSLNPSTNIEFWSGHKANEEDANDAITAAKQAFPAWSKMDVENRYIHIQKFSDQLTQNKQQLAELISTETGKPLWEALTEVNTMIGKATISKTAFEKRTSPFTSDAAGKSSITKFKPHGVVLVLGPFNFPGHLPNGHIIPALLAGNTIVFKPSEQTPAVAEFMLQLWEKAKLPAGVLNLVYGDVALGQALLANKNIRGVYFTGSSGAGLSIKKSLLMRPEVILALEMGGNNPLVIWKTKDLQASAYQAILSAYITAGQRCTCARRLIIQNNSEGDQFLQELMEQIKNIKVGLAPSDPEPFMGPVISNHAANQILQSQQNLIHSKAHALLESKRVIENRPLLTPGLLDVSKVKSRPDEEIFGPILQVIRVNTFEDALIEANNTRYGLAAGLISDDKNLFEDFYLQVNAGLINFNTPLTGASSLAPFGGIGHSGNHRPSAYFASDYCSYPVACLSSEKVEYPQNKAVGLK